MNVVFDSNIFRQDMGLRSNRITVLLDYLRRTESKLVIPQVVWEELLANYERLLRQEAGKLEQAHREVKKILVSDTLAPLAALDIEAEISRYKQKILTTFGLTEADIVPYRPEYLEDVVRRATRRKRPCSDSGEEIRDAIVWLSVKDIAHADGDHRVVFISANKKQFAHEKDEHSLHPDLAAEEEAEGLLIRFAGSLDHFLKEFSVKIDYVTPDWIRAMNDIREVENDAMMFLEHDEQNQLLQWAARRGHALTGKLEVRSVKVDVGEFSVYEREEQDELLVSVTYRGQAEVVFERLVGLVVMDATEDKPFVTSELIAHPNIAVTAEMVAVNDEKSIRHVVTYSVSVEE
jgi:predicted nucleic acid-binding protein